MISMAPSLPPSVPRDEAILGALSLLSALGNAQNTAATLTQMVEHKQAIDAATAENNAAAAAAAAAQAELANLQERERLVTEREAAVGAAQTQLQVASAANVARDQALKDREAESDKREAEITARAKALHDRLEAYRKALA
jgi:hypothetical protein